MDKIHVYMGFHFASVNSTAGNKTRFFPSPFIISTSRFFILVKAFRSDHVAACGTVVRRDTEKNEMGGCIIVLCSSRMT